MEAMDSLLAELSRKYTPCDRYSCPNRNRCALDELACDAWIYYVQVGFATHPQMVIPLRRSRTNRPYMGESIVATREKFDYAWNDESRDEEKNPQSVG